MENLTPMMRQYLDIKNQHKDYILFYRLGDFYEMFFEDAILVSKTLELTLTGKSCGLEERAPMCGVPYHSAEQYIARLVKQGFKVAICEQTEDAKSTKGIVKREVVRMITPGTVIEASMLEETKNNFLASVYQNNQGIGVCFCDISTGEVHAICLKGKEKQRELISEIARFIPKEILLCGDAVSNDELIRFAKDRLDSNVEPIPEQMYEYEKSHALILQQFKVTDSISLGLTDVYPLECSVGGLLSYLLDTQKATLRNITELQIYEASNFMVLDLNTRRNLELCETMRSKEKKGSLLWVMDKTNTAMGSRLIRQWIEKPLLNPVHIKKRQEAVRGIMSDLMAHSNLTEQLKALFDMERLMGRVIYGNANCRDLRALYETLNRLPQIKDTMVLFPSPLIRELTSRIDDFQDICHLINTSIVDKPPVTVREGGFIRDGYNQYVDEYRELSSGGKGSIAKIEQRERETTGIKGLKVGYNRVFGYFIEVSRLNSDIVPEHYIRKQTLANCERYITEELKEHESAVLGAQDKLTALEYDLFCEIREKIAVNIHKIQRASISIANIDVISSFATLAIENQYVCPEIDFSGIIDIKDGRHPVVEKIQNGNMFVPNDTILDNRENRTCIITGPNMAGKSTYMRQVAIIAIMAQIGSFVPASNVRLGVVDRVFTRVGASDDLASGQSTFMVEMTEVADILKNATKNSLLILDEIGRGTSTYDGMSIARAVVEYVTDKKRIGARTLFATHYHELTELENLVDGIKNYNIVVKKRGDDITFLRKIVRGGADDSYGIEVAKLAGVPNPVINRAKIILKDLEENTTKIEIAEIPTQDDELQISMDNVSSNQISEALKKMQIDTMTPIEAMNELYKLKKMVQ